MRNLWSIPDDVTYLNHGSFGPTPREVFSVQQEWSQRLAAQPMNFFLREMEPALHDAANVLAKFVGTEARHLVFTDNATVAMNVVARSFPLAAGDEVLLNDHEYGAVQRIWREAAAPANAKVVTVRIPVPIKTADDMLEPLFAAVSERTKLIVISHVTSPTAIVFPVAEVCRRARELGIAVCIDGPHAMAMRDVSIKDLGCDFYCASLHKWLSAPLGTGFLYASPKWQSRMVTPIVSWGRSVGGLPAKWQDEFNWLGTRNPAGFLAVPAAIGFLERQGIAKFRESTHESAREARHMLEAVTGHAALVPDSRDWYGSMIAVPLPVGGPQRSQPNAMDPLQQVLWEQHRIEVPVVAWHGRRHLRVSCQLYNTPEDLQRLEHALCGLL